MKQKKIQVLLLVGVVVIWIFVLKKAFSIWGTDSDVVVAVTQEKPVVSIPEFKKDTFTLTIPERDPFLDFKVVSIRENKPKKTIQVSKTKIEPNIVWPKLQYFGYLKGDTKSGKMVLMKIDNKLHRIRENNTVLDVHIVRAYRDSVVLRRNGTIKTISKNN